MSRIYSVSFTALTKSVPSDFVGIYAGSVALKIREVGLASYDAASDVDLDLLFIRLSGTVTRGSGGNVPAIVKSRSTDQTASFVAHVNDTTQGSATTSELWIGYALDVQKGLIYSPKEELCLIIQPGEACVIASGSVITPNLDGYVLVEELS